MSEWDARSGPSPEARAFLADPTNRKDDPITPAQLPLERAEGLSEAEAEAPAIAARFDVTLDWNDIGGCQCLTVTPDKIESGPEILYLFGGGFISGGPLEDLAIIAPIAAQTGTRVIAPKYRLAPEHPWPAGLDDACAVAEALAERGGYSLAGESAGGNLALCVVQRLAARGVPTPHGLALLSPAADLSDAFDPDTAPDDPTLSRTAINEIPKLYAPGQNTRDPAISPLYGRFGPDWPATLITTGTHDRFLGQCARLERTIRDTGAAADLRIWDGLWHVFEYYPEIPEAALSLTEISTFLTQCAERNDA